MKSPVTLLLGILFTALGVATVFFDVPFLEQHIPFNHGFLQGFVFGLGPMLIIAAFVKRKQEQGTQK